MLYIWMPEADETWGWSQGDTWHNVASLELLIQQIQLFSLEQKNLEAVVFFSSQQAQLITHTVARQQYKQLANEGIAYLIEDHITQPLDHMQVRHSFVAPDQVHLMAVAQHHLDTWRHSLSLLPVTVVALLPDFLLLPAPLHPQQLMVGQVAGRLLARQGPYQGQRIDDLAVFASFQAHKTEIVALDLTEAQQQTLKSSPDITLSTASVVFDATGLNRAHPFNLMPKAKRQKIGSGYWLGCAALIFALIFVQLGYDLLRYVKLKQVADQTAQQAIAQYQTWFGANSRVTEQNLKSMFQSQIQSSQTGNLRALDLLSRVGPILAQKQIVAQELRFESDSLSLLLKAKTADELQALNQQLNQQGFKAELGNVQADGAAAVGMLKVN